MNETTTQPTRKRITKVYHAALIAAFARLNRVGDVAQVTGISRRTIQRWRADPANWAEVVEAQRGFLADTLSKFRNALPELAAGMVDMAKNTDEPAAARLQASMGCFEMFSALSQGTELKQRLAAIEEALRACQSQVSVLAPATSRLASWEVAILGAARAGIERARAEMAPDSDRRIHEAVATSNAPEGASIRKSFRKSDGVQEASGNEDS